MKKRIAVLGCGRIGSLIARRLSGYRDCEVRVYDSDPAALEKVRGHESLIAETADLADPAGITTLAKGCDLVVGALPSRIGYRAMEAVIESGRSLVDISFLPEDPSDLDRKARETGSTVVYDIGVAPGLSHLLAGRGASMMDTVDTVQIRVGGLPLKPRPPFNYAACYAPSDVLEEYTRPVHIVENGELVVREALSHLETVDLPGVDGPLEAFLTDGLRSLNRTVKAREMWEKTLRWPGHAEQIRLLERAGFLSEEPIRLKGNVITPREATAAMLFPQWELKEGETEFTVMRVEVSGEKKGKQALHRWDLIDFTDRERGETSMARMTGLPCVYTARAVIEGGVSAPGVHPPESFANDGRFFEGLLDFLRGEGVSLEETTL
jgi:saccharopine dehydrogenase-like NADP-dependent oxidoreductase